MAATVKRNGTQKGIRTAAHVKTEQQDKKPVKNATRKLLRSTVKREASIENDAPVMQTSSPEQDHEVALRRSSNRTKVTMTTIKRKPVEGKKEDVRVDTSCITEDGLAAKIPEPFDVPMASSPVNTPRMASTVADEEKSDVSEGRVSANEARGSTKSHRGIVAEMYAHERRQARTSTSAAGKTVNGIATGLLNPVHASKWQPGMPSITTSPAFYPYGLPAMPPAEPVLSPFGISPYAEPGSSWTTNVYVNNLPPHTTDDDLLRLGSCFGKIKSHKAIINQETGLCKGYGFLMYEFLHDAELALQQLPLHGLSTSWAKESFSSKLRRMADSTTSNIYLSNLPSDITTVQLEQMFAPHQVISLRILTDSATGKPRGVGFVRLRDRAAAQDCIERLNGLVVPGQESALQVRFADSEAQKSFKMCARVQLSKADDSRRTVDTSQTVEPSFASTHVSNNSTSINGTPQQIFVAALQGQHTWTGYPTPIVPSAGDFSPLLGAGSAIVQAQIAEHDALMQQMGMQQQHFDAKDMAYGVAMPFVNYNRHAFDAIDASALQRLQWMSNAAAAQSTRIQPVNNRRASNGVHGALSHKLNPPPAAATNGVRATYLPPELAMQHARALMEKKVEARAIVPSARANVAAMTEQHIEKERADLLKLLKMTTLKGDESSQSDIVTDHSVKSRNGRSYSISATKSSNAERESMHVLADIRQSVSSNALSPFRFMRSEQAAVLPPTSLKDAQAHSSPPPLPRSTNIVDRGDDNDDDNDNNNNDDDNHTVSGTDMADESNYTSSVNTSGGQDDSQRSSNASAVSMHKSDSGKNFDCGALDVYGDRHAVDVPIDAKHVTTTGGGGGGLHPTPTKGRSRSKSILLHLPLTQINESQPTTPPLPHPAKQPTTPHQ